MCLGCEKLFDTEIASRTHFARNPACKRVHDSALEKVVTHPTQLSLLLLSSCAFYRTAHNPANAVRTNHTEQCDRFFSLQ